MPNRSIIFRAVPGSQKGLIQYTYVALWISKISTRINFSNLNPLNF